MKFWSAAFIIVLSVSSCSRGQDLCYLLDSQYGPIGNCIDSLQCSTNITVPNACPSYPSNFICCFDPQFPSREVRGAWIATVSNIDWPTSAYDSVAKQQQDLYKLIDSLRAAGINTIYFQVRPAGDALYGSRIEPWSKYLTTAQGVAPDPLWDPLEYAIYYCHSKGMEVHAWLNPYRANLQPNSEGLAANHMAKLYPQYAYPYSTFLWMDPGAEIVQNQTYSVVMDLVERYDIDGIHFDDYFYPYPVQGQDFPDDVTYNDYVSRGGTLARDDWRRQNVNALVERLNIGIHQLKSHVKFSISPFGIYRPCEPEGMPCSIVGFDQYSGLFADPKLWLQNGWIDVLQPQLYWKIDPPQQSYPVLLDWWVQINTMDRHVYAGNYISRIYEGWNLSEIKNQIEISRKDEHRKRGSWGNIQFSAKVFGLNSEGSIEYFRYSVYPYPALQPEFPWLANGKSAPKEPKVENILGRTSVLRMSDDCYKLALYKQTRDGSWHLLEVFISAFENLQLDEGSYAASCLDRFGQESKKILFII